MKTQAFAIAAIGAVAGIGGALAVSAIQNRNSATPPALFVENAPRSNFGNVREAYAPVEAAPFDFRAAAKRVSPSVVSVDRYQRVQRGMFDDGGTDQETGTGSGVIVGNDGTIVTNNHVVAGLENGGRVMVRLSDKRSFPAKILGADPRSDLAVIKIEAKNLTPIELGTSDSVEVGQWVLAIGNPLGFDNTVSVGVVSSLKRNLPVGDQGLVGAIQTDAAINPGNSGGALCDAQGRLIGINSAIATNNQGSVGIGFAIPIDRVKKITGDIVKYGEARYATLGVSYLPYPLEAPQVRARFAQEIGREDFPTSGVIVKETTAGAANAGIRAMDVLTKIDGTDIRSSLELNSALLDRKPGDQVKVEYWSKGETKSATVTLEELKTRL